MRGDYHTHHHRCGHAAGEIEEYIQAAVAHGFAQVGITDHAPHYWLEGDHPLPYAAMAKSELPAYVDEVLALKKQYAGRIEVLLGLECDYAPGFEDAYRALRAEYPWDYWIGSVHHCQGLHIYHHERWASMSAQHAELVYAEYFQLVRDSTGSGLFDVLGHITGIFATGPAPSAAFMQREFAPTAQAIAASGVAIEINSSGIRKGQPGPFPRRELLELCARAGVPLCYGSDSHLPEELGHARSTVRGILKELAATGQEPVMWHP